MYLGIFQDFQFCAICWSDKIIFYYYKVLVIKDFKYILTYGVAIPSPFLYQNYPRYYFSMWKLESFCIDKNCFLYFYWDGTY